MTLPASFVLSCLLSATALLAQTPPHLVGLTRNTGDLRHISLACGGLATCAPAGFPSAAALPPAAGGTAYDPMHSGIWLSNGTFLGCVDDACNYRCTPFAVAGLGGAVITGLEVVASQNRLWAIDSNDLLRTFDLSNCPPQPAAACTVAFANNYVTTGLAVDELNSLVFYLRYDPATNANFVTVAPLATPCLPSQLVLLPACAAVGAGLLTGLAVDGGNRRLYATNGFDLLTLGYAPMPASTIALTGANCCSGGGADPVIGLALRPGRATSLGASCAAGSCFACPMVHDTVNESVLGNADFALRLDGAPAGSVALAFVGVGACWNPGVPVAPFCGLAHVSAPLLGTLGANLVPPGGVCNPTAFPLALPPALGLAGLVLSSQCLVLCAAGGNAMSNCVSFELQGL